MKNDIQSLKNVLTTAKEDLDKTRNKLDLAQKDLTEKTKTLNKLDKKYVKEEDELKRCLIIIDGVKEQHAQKPKSVISSLLSDLDINHNDHDIKLAFRIGPYKKGIARPQSIRIEFLTPNTKGEIFKNSDKLRNLDQWKGVYLSDALPSEQNQQNVWSS